MKKYATFINILKNLDHKLDRKRANYNYFDLGKKVIWEELSKLRKANYEYYHYDSSFDGSRLKNKRWMRAEYYFNQDNELLNENNLLVIFLANRDISGPSPRHNTYKNVFEQFLKLNKQEILQQNYWLAKMFRKSFGM